MTVDGTSSTAPEGAQVEVRIVTGGTPTAQQEAALSIAVSRVITQRDLTRSTPPPVWGAVGRLEARDGLAIRSRAALPRTTTWSPDAEGPE